MLQLNLVSLVLAVGWFFSTQDRWEPAIVFLGLLGAFAIQVRPYFSSGDTALPKRHRLFVLTALVLAFFLTRPSGTAHFGALLKFEFEQAAKSLDKSVGGPLIGLTAMAIAPAKAWLSQRHLNLVLASASIGPSTLTVGALGYVVVFNPTPHVATSYEGEKFFVEFRAEQKRMMEFFEAKKRAP